VSRASLKFVLARALPSSLLSWTVVAMAFNAARVGGLQEPAMEGGPAFKLWEGWLPLLADHPLPAMQT
jgi:hypothetical protein